MSLTRSAPYVLLKTINYRRVTVLCKSSIFWVVIGFPEYLIVRPLKGRRDDKNDKTR